MKSIFSSGRAITALAALESRPEGVRLLTMRDPARAHTEGIRGKIVHDYEQVDTVIVRGVVSRGLPAPIAEVRRALDADEVRKIAAAPKAAQQPEQVPPRTRRRATLRSTRVLRNRPGARAWRRPHVVARCAR